MEPFATPAEYKAKYGSDLDDVSLSEWLADASGILQGELDASGVDATEMGDALMRVCRDMVHRAVGGDGGEGFGVPFGATQYNQTAGSYSVGFSMGNPYGDLFLTSAERRRLGIDGERIAVLSPYGGA